MRPDTGEDRVRILFLASNPMSTSRLRLDEEIRSIRRRLRAADYREVFEIRSHWAVRPDDLLQILNEYRPHIVHFSGHGGEKGIVLIGGGKSQACGGKCFEGSF